MPFVGLRSGEEAWMEVVHRGLVVDAVLIKANEEEEEEFVLGDIKSS